MKFWVVLLSSYLFILTCIPCNVFCSEHDSETHDHHSEQKQDLNQHHVCSPFCMHGACTEVFRGLGFDFLVEITDLEPKLDYPSYAFIFTPDVLLSVWQPPKIMINC